MVSPSYRLHMSLSKCYKDRSKIALKNAIACKKNGDADFGFQFWMNRYYDCLAKRTKHKRLAQSIYRKDRMAKNARRHFRYGQ